MCCSAKPLQQQSSVARENGTVLFSVDFRKLSTTEHSAYLRGHVLATSSVLLQALKLVPVPPEVSGTGFRLTSHCCRNYSTCTKGTTGQVVLTSTGTQFF